MLDPTNFYIEISDYWFLNNNQIELRLREETFYIKLKYIDSENIRYKFRYINENLNEKCYINIYLKNKKNLNKQTHKNGIF